MKAYRIPRPHALVSILKFGSVNPGGPRGPVRVLLRIQK